MFLISGDTGFGGMVGRVFQFHNNKAQDATETTTDDSTDVPASVPPGGASFEETAVNTPDIATGSPSKEQLREMETEAIAPPMNNLTTTATTAV